jgi:hypothetical protein
MASGQPNNSSHTLALVLQKNSKIQKISKNFKFLIFSNFFKNFKKN